MLPQIAETFLEIALLMSLIQAFSWIKNLRTGRFAALFGFGALSTSFAMLLYFFVSSDFSLKVVFENSHTLKPLIYRFTGTWGNHEGSLMLLLWIISAYNAAYAIWGKDNLVVYVHGGVIFLLMAFTVFASNPFLIMPFAPVEGMGLNPVLQDIGLAMHPPVLYAGYIGFSLVYAICIAALIRGKFSPELAQEARKVSLFAWSFLTLGIMFGSWWAYRELGWGGFWFWDPVENCSLMPWLTGAALLHSLMVTEKKGAIKKWTILLGIVTFCLSIMGFFLVRSGVLMSVHSFASDPERGIFILIILAILAGFALILFGVRAHKFTNKTKLKPISREMFILWNNLFFSVLAAVVALGTLYPILLEAFAGQAISVGPPYFVKTFTPILAALIALTIAATYLWRNSSPMIISHIGFLLVMVGIIGASYFASEKEITMKPEQTTEFAGYQIKFAGIILDAKHNYVFRRAEFVLMQGEKELAFLKPESRYYPVEEQKTTEAAIATKFLTDIYIVIGEQTKEGEFAVRMYKKPLINLIWLGSVIIFIGSFWAFARKIFPHKKTNY